MKWFSLYRTEGIEIIVWAGRRAPIIHHMVGGLSLIVDESWGIDT